MTVYKMTENKITEDKVTVDKMITNEIKWYTLDKENSVCH